MSVHVEIVGQAARLRIEVLGYENPSPQTPSDANWLSCRIEVVVGGFEGRVGASLTAQDFVVFHQALRSSVDALRKGAVFETDEDALRLNVEMRATGTAVITGILHDWGRATSLSFSFESDQTYLRQTVGMLGKVIRQYPVRK